MKNLPDTTLQKSKHLHGFSDEEAYSLILNNLQDTFILVDRDLKIITATEQTKLKVRQYYHMEVYTGMSIFKLVDPDRIPYLTELYASILNGGPERNTEIEFKYNGNPVIIKSHFKAAKNNEGEIVGIVITTREITEEKMAARQLNLAEERWRFALEGAQQGVWDWNMQTGECFYSQGYKKLYGYEDHELLNHINEWQSLIHPEDREKMQVAVQEHSSSDNPFHESTYRIKAKDGKYKWVMARGMIIEKDGQGKPLRMIGTHTDISEQVMAREKIRNSEQHYRNLFQSNPLPCWIYDLETLRFLEVNQAAIEHYGFSREEFLNADLYLIHPVHYLEKLSLRLDKEKKVSSSSFNNWKHRKKNGEEIFVDLNINSIRYNDSEAKLVVAHDVTNKVEMEIAQKKTEEELRKSNERFQLASMASSDAIYDWDIIKNELYWGEGITTLFGYDSKEMTMERWQEKVHPDDREATLSSLKEALKNKTKWSLKYRLARKTGQYHYVLERGFIIRDDSGNASRMIGSVQDITDLVVKEEELLASNERYEYATLATSDIIWDWDIIKNEVVWSDNFQKIMGWQLPPNKIIDINFCAELFHPDDRERVQTKINELINDPGKNLWQEEFRYLKADGTYSYVTDRGYVLRNKNNEAVRIIGAMQDITERKYYEQLLSLERQIFEMSANLNVTLPQIADTLLNGIESITPGS
ncbi:MAG TPA: PAS domain-containing protein, partial [Flavisolibacter sp.]